MQVLISALSYVKYAIFQSHNVRRNGLIFGLLYLEYGSLRSLYDSLISINFIIYIPKVPMEHNLYKYLYIRAYLIEKVIIVTLYYFIGLRNWQNLTKPLIVFQDTVWLNQNCCQTSYWQLGIRARQELLLQRNFYY